MGVSSIEILKILSALSIELSLKRISVFLVHADLEKTFAGNMITADYSKAALFTKRAVVNGHGKTEFPSWVHI